MSASTIVWTALPSGLGPLGQPRISIFVSPRIESADDLRKLANWPERLTKLHPLGSPFQVALDMGAGETLRSVLLTSQRLLRPDAWTALFAERTKLKRYAFRDHSKRLIQSFDAKPVVEAVLDAYRETAARSPTSFPRRDQAGRALKDLLAARPATGPVIASGGGTQSQPLAPVLSRLNDVLSEWKGGTDKERLFALFGGSTGTSDPKPLAFLRAALFYRRPGTPTRALMNPADIPAGPKTTDPDYERDFHELVAALGDYPSIERALGFVLDGLVVDCPFALLGASGTVRVVPPSALQPDGFANPLTPRTRLTSSFSAARRSGSDLTERGCLGLSRSQYHVTQLDVDGAALRTIDFAANMAFLDDRVAKETKEKFIVSDGSVSDKDAQAAAAKAASEALQEQSLPALRTGGFSILREDRATVLGNHFLHASQLQADGEDAILYLDDVVRGYRVDVQQRLPNGAWSPWLSLCRRYGTLALGSAAPVVLPFGDTATPRLNALLAQAWARLADAGVGPDVLGGLAVFVDKVLDRFLPNAHDEGFVKAAGATSLPKTGATQTDDRMYLHESVFGWDGWSLAAPRPGKTISQTEDGASLVQHEPSEPSLATPDLIQAIVRPLEGSLPRLRFGETYRFRARAADLAGNGPPHSTDDATDATPPARYQRYEPVASPTLVPQAIFAEGESAEALVIRSDRGGKDDKRRSAEEYSASLDGAHALWMSEHPPHHPVGKVQNPELPRYAATAERWLAPPKTSQAMVEAHGCLDALLMAGKTDAAYDLSVKESGTFLDDAPGRWIVTPADLSPEGVQYMGQDHVQLGDGLAAGQYVLHTERPALPYLPDPMSAGVCVVLVEGGVPSAFARWAWYDAGGARPTEFHDIAVRSLVAREVTGTERPSLDSSAAEPTVLLPPATIAEVRISSVPKPESVQEGKAGPLALWNLMVEDDTTGNPSEPAVLGRTVGDAARIGTHWMLTPFRVVKLVHAVPKPLEKPAFVPASATIPCQHIPRAASETFARFAVGGLSAHGRSTVRVDVVAEWSETHDLPAKRGRPEAERHEGHAFVVPFQYDQTLVGGLVTYAQKNWSSFGTHEFGDTKYRRVTYTPIGMTRYAAYFPPCVTSDSANLTLAGEAIQRDVESTARPEPPKVLYVVPTFTWTESPDGTSRTRGGGGLRVYVDRAWYSSGEGERLAVLLCPANPTETERRALENRVSEWGSDPIWRDATALPALGLDAFLRFAPSPFRKRLQDLETEKLSAGVITDLPGDAPAVLTGVHLPEAGTTVDVVSYAPEFSEERQLWYFDLDVDPGEAYFPFIRLALARIQPVSTSGLHLSRLVMAEFAQLTADRYATFTKSDGNLEVTLSGYCGTDSQAVPFSSIGLLKTTTTASETAVGASGRGPLPVDLDMSIELSKRKAPQPGHVVRAQLQHLVPGDDPDLGWIDEGQPVTLESWEFALKPGYASWRGAVPLPRSAAGFEWRVLLTESEVFEADADVAERTEFGFRTRNVSERVVYADTFALRGWL